jgi:4-amino-4-deoxy-L-arabinose transferase-like glycosyltransferase
MMSGSVRKDDIGLAGLAARIDAGLPAWMTVRTIFLGLLLVSLCVDLGFGFLYKFRPGPLQLEADEFEYYRMATRLMDGSFVLTARRTLAYPLAIAGIRSISDSFLFLQAVIAAVFSFSAPLLFLVVRRVTGSIKAAALSGLALALWPPVLFYAASLYSEVLALPVFLLSLWALPPGSRTGRPPARRDWIQAIAAGVLLAAATQVRPMYLIMTPFVVLIMLFEERDLRRALRRIVLVAAAFTVTTLPWSAYMTARFHHPILVTSNGGETMAGGLTPKLFDLARMAQVKTRGRDAWVGPGKWLIVAQNGYLTPAEQGLPYDQQDALLKARAMAWVKANPGAAFQLEAAKLLYMWGFYPLSQNSWGQIVLGSAPTIALLAFALYCLATMPIVRTALARFWILPIFVSAVAAISWGSWRFRQPGDAGLIAFCVICLLIRQATRRAPDGPIAS